MHRPYSFTKITTYLRCPTWYKFSYLDGRAGFETDSGALGWEVHQAISRHVRGLDATISLAKLTPKQHDWARTLLSRAIDILGDLGEPIATEMSFALDEVGLPVEFEDPGAFVRGIIDLITVKDGFIHVWDWKTGREKGSALQLKIYALAASTIFNMEVASAGFIYLSSGNVETILNEGDLGRAFEELLSLAERIESDGSFKPKAGAHCYYCPHIMCCPARQFFDEKEIRLSDPEGVIAACEKLLWLEAATKTLRDLAREYVETNGPVEKGDWSVSVVNGKLRVELKTEGEEREEGRSEDGSV